MTSRNRNFLKWGFVFFAGFLIVSFVIAEIALRLNGISAQAERESNFVVEPSGFFHYDSICGWQNGKGSYAVFREGKKAFEFRVNESGNRFIAGQDSQPIKHAPVIHVYGCSYTFGFSVDDTSTGCYKLQQMLPGVQVVNKGVPAYGLAQMYLSLQHSLSNGDTPQIAVFNYSDFHDLRTPISKQWSLAIRESIPQDGKAKFENWALPYFEYKNNSLQLGSCAFKELSKPWALAEVSSVILVFNSIYNSYLDGENAAYRHKISHETAVEIMRYCKAHNIVPVFAYILNSNDVNTFSENAAPMTDIQNDIARMGYYTVNYGIDIRDKRYKNKGWGHPNAAAHSIFATTLKNFLLQKHLIQNN